MTGAANFQSPSMTGSPAAPPERVSTLALPLRTRLAILLRLFAIQGAWNYEILLGNGIGFCVEPALRLLPGGVGGPAYRAALARQAKQFAVSERHGTRRCLDGGIGLGSLRLKGREKVVSLAFRRQTSRCGKAERACENHRTGIGNHKPPFAH